MHFIKVLLPGTTDCIIIQLSSQLCDSRTNFNTHSAEDHVFCICGVCSNH